MSKGVSGKLSRQIFRLHCQGHAISKIARKLGLDDEAVRACIVEKWREDEVWEGWQ